ncbi:MAG: PAS domain S-box protein, partial [Pseudomonadota bacterium]
MARRPSPKKASAPKAGPQKASRPGATPVPEGPLPIQALLDAMHDTAMLVDLSGTILAVNRVACQRLGKTEEELLGADARKLRPADYSKEVSGRVVEVLTSQKAVRFTARSGDDILDTTISPVAGEGGKVESLAFFIRNITEQEATRAERSRLVEILENTSDLVGIATPDGRQSYLNRAGRRMLGWEETGDLGHRSVAEAHPPWAREKGLWVGETAILDPGGREIPVSQAIMAHGPKGGPVEYWSTIIRDISGAREALGLLEIQRDLGMAMAEARELPQALNRVLSAAQGVRPGSGAGVFLAEPPEGPLTLAAARGLPENLGRLGSVLLPDHPLALLAGVACPAYLPAGDLGLPDHEGAAAVVPLFSENRVEGVLVVLDAGEKGFSPAHRAALEGVASQAGRTLSRLRAGQRLKDSEEKHRSILENIEEGYWEQDLAGNFTFFNPSLCRVLGYTKRELMGMSFRQYVSPGTARRLYSLFNEMFRTGRPIRVTQYEAIRKDGRSIPVECTASLIRGPDGKPSGFRGLLRDVSERTRVEEQLGRLEERLLQSQKMEALGTLA